MIAARPLAVKERKPTPVRGEVTGIISIGSAATGVGRHRDRNEYCFISDDELGLYAVSDGMGGHAAGEIASSTTIDAARAAVTGRRADLMRNALGDSGAQELVNIAREAVRRGRTATPRR